MSHVCLMWTYRPLHAAVTAWEHGGLYEMEPLLTQIYLIQLLIFL